MSLTAHPFIVAAELSWKQECLGRANLGGHVAPPSPTGARDGTFPALCTAPLAGASRSGRGPPEAAEDRPAGSGQIRHPPHVGAHLRGAA